MNYTDTALTDIPLIREVIFYEETDSTNARAKDLIRAGAEGGTLVAADMQTAGRGRLGRSFSSPSGEGIYMSLILKPELSPDRFSMLTILAAMAIARAFEALYDLKADIKWPNDILVNNKKTVGILTEGVPPDHVIIGIGINVNNREFPDSLVNAGSLLLETGQPQDRGTLLYTVLSGFSELYARFLSSQDLSFITEEYNRRLIHMDKEIFVIPFDRTMDSADPYALSTEGLSPVLCRGIEKSGALMVEDTAGHISFLNSGEVSVRFL